MAELVYRPVIGIARLLFAYQGLRFDLRGTQHVPRSGGAVMAINHIGYFDFTYAGLAVLPAHRLVRFMAKEEVFSHRIAGPLMRGMHHIPVDRAAGAASFRAALEALLAGEIVGVFPEATISRSFELKEFKPGAVRLAAAGGAPLLPTVVWGSQRVWTKGHRRLGRTHTPITVCVGTPIVVEPGCDPAVETDNLRARMSAMLHEVQESYAESPPPADSWWLPDRLGGSAPTAEQAEQLDRDERRARIEAAKKARDAARPR